MRRTSSLGTLFLGEGQSAQNKRGCHLPLTATHRTRSHLLSPAARLPLVFYLSSDLFLLCFCPFLFLILCFMALLSHHFSSPSSLDFLCDFSVSLSQLFLMSLHLSLSFSCLCFSCFLSSVCFSSSLIVTPLFSSLSYLSLPFISFISFSPLLFSFLPLSLCLSVSLLCCHLLL